MLDCYSGVWLEYMRLPPLAVADRQQLQPHQQPQQQQQCQQQQQQQDTADLDILNNIYMDMFK